MSFLSLRSGIITTFYYNGEAESTEIRGLFPCVKRKYDEEDYSDSEGMIYAFGEDMLGKFALDGDVLNGKAVRKQEISVEGYTYTVGKIRPVYNGGAVHHFEIGVI